MTHIAKLDYPGKDIRMYVSTPVEETYRVNACAKEPWTTAWIEAMPPGSVLYDVGANVGSYTLLAASLGHTVVAIEPGFANYARLCENVLLNDLGPLVIPVCVALGEHPCGYTLIEQDEHPGYSGGSRRMWCSVFRLDDLLRYLPRPTHIKVDVDGREYGVIQGMGGMLTAASLMVEIGVPIAADGKNGIHKAEYVQAHPIEAASPGGKLTVDHLAGQGYVLRQHWVSTGSTPLAWYGLFEQQS